MVSLGLVVPVAVGAVGIAGATREIYTANASCTSFDP